MLKLWVKTALDASGISQAELARRLTMAVGRSIDRAAVNKMIGGAREVAADEMLAIAKITKFPAPESDMEIPERKVKLVGYVGAGAEAHFYSDSQGPFDEVAAPDNSTPQTVAVQIKGESMGALFDGWLVFYSDINNPPGDMLVGRMCVCGLADGRVLIKGLKRSREPGLWHLLSNNEPTIYDVALEWAAEVKDMRPR